MPNKNKGEQTRVDKFLVQEGHAISRDRAIDLIKQEGVEINGKVINKPGTKITPGDEITLVKQDIPWVSRGALKLEEALKTWNIDPADKTCLDIGAATGGFTEVLLHGGARKVYAVDVGRGQLAEKLRQDRRVVNLEKINFKNISKNKIKEKGDLICIDVSYISLTLILEKAKNFLKGKGAIIALIKPQFEMEEKARVGKGVIKEAEKHEYAIEKIENFAEEIGLKAEGVIDSPILGGKGNKEFLMLLKIVGH
jgi:23S rRNA (cytidine1920-2'-O)/16S rRNA (cytidine1409-2'-O)-methyltransferase